MKLEYSTPPFRYTYLCLLLVFADKAGRRVEGLEKLYGSQLIWKIDNYSSKLEEAKAGKKPTIFSPPFLTSRHGYKLAMSCCLYGDGKGKIDHPQNF